MPSRSEFYIPLVGAWLGLVTPVTAETYPDVMGEMLRCETRPAVSAYCTAPEVASHAAALNKIIAESLTNDPSVASTVSDMTGTLLWALRGCANDVACVEQALTDATEQLGEVTGAPQPAPVLDEDLAAIIAAARDTAKAGREEELALQRAEDKADQEAAARAKDAQDAAWRAEIEVANAVYAEAWEKAGEMLAPYPLALMELVETFDSPDAHAEKREELCGADLRCQARFVDDGRFFLEFADRKMKAGQVQEGYERQIELAERNARIEQEIQRQESAFQERIRLEQQEQAKAELKSRLKPDSLLLLYLEGRHEELAERWTEIVRYNHAAFARQAGATFVNDYTGKSLFDGVMANRGNLLIAEYAKARLRVLGLCNDDQTQEVYRGYTSGTITRTVSGIYIGSTPGYHNYQTVPSHMARFMKAANPGGTSRYFRADIEAFETCDHPLRRGIEWGLIDFVDRGMVAFKQ